MNEKTKQDLVNKGKQELQSASIEEILNWAVDYFGDEIGMTTTCSYNSVVILNKLRKINSNIQLYFFDTGYHFKETLSFVKKLRKQWNLNLKICKPDITHKELTEKLGDPPYEMNPDKCCYYNKVTILKKILPRKQAWIASLRRDQTENRKYIHPIDIDDRDTIKIHPLYNWHRNDVWQHIHEHKLPYNPLYDKNYHSIGCEPCTTPIENPKDERECRWSGTSKSECGLNQYNHLKEN